MGLTIHYNGKFNLQMSLRNMIEEVKDIAEIHNWKHHVYGTEFPNDAVDKDEYDQKIYGITFVPPNSEPIYLTFLSNGRMSSEHGLRFWGNSKNEIERGYMYMLSTKTQFAGSEVHKLIIHLLKYLRGKYFEELNVHDEGKYWETNDEKLLEEIFEEYNIVFDYFETAINTIPLKNKESYEEYFKRILKIISKKRKE